MAATRVLLALLVLTAVTSGIAHADEGRAFDITTATSAPRKVLTGGSEGLLASAASRAVLALQGALEAFEALVLGESNTVKELSGLENFKKAIDSDAKAVVYFHASQPPYSEEYFERYSTYYSDIIAFYQVNSQTEKDIVKTTGLDPTWFTAADWLFAYKNGRIVGKTPFRSGDDLLNVLHGLLEEGE